MSYRSSYVPYKSNLPTTSYKSGSTSAYSSRDDVTTNDIKNTNSSRFTTLPSPSAYRPAYSGGTYRSIPIKRDNNYTPYVSRYPSSSNVNNDKEKSVEPSSTKTTSTTNKYLGSNSARDTTPVCNHKISRYTSTSTGNLSRYGPKSRDPSPAIDRRTSPAPLSNTLRARSRDPSPALQDNKLSSSSSAKLNSAGNYPTYRMGSRPTSSGYGSNSRYGSNSSSLPRSSASLAERALSYMTTNEVRSRVKQQREKSAERKVKEQEAADKDKSLSESTNSAAIADPISTIETLEEQNSITTYPSTDIEPEIFISVKVVTRATSPTPPGSTTFTRTRRLDIAKTIEKTIQRSSRKPIYADKEMQSDRLDDSTKYSRFGSGRLSSCTWSDSSKYSSGKYSGSSAASTPSRTSSRNEIESIDKSKKDENSVGSGKISLNKVSVKKDSQSSKGTSESSKSSKLSPPKLVNTSTVNKQKSTENSVSSSSVARSSLPPTCPKSDSSTKQSTSTSATSNLNTKWTNKDFRKSALNVGPTDRPRKSRTPSDSEDNQTKSGSGAAFINGTFQYVQRLERSPSVGSETSNTSTATSSSLSNNNTSDNNQENNNNNNKIRCHQPKIKTSHQKTQIPNQIIQSQQSNIKILDNNKKNLGNDINKKNDSNRSGCDENYTDDNNLTTGKENEKLPPTPPTQTLSSTTALFKYLQINSPPPPPIESSSSSSISSHKQQPQQLENDEPPLQINLLSMKNDDNNKNNNLIRKMGSLSNFLIAKVEQDSDSEQIYFDNNSSSNNSISDGLKQNVTIASNAAITTTTTTKSLIASKLSKKNNSLKKNLTNNNEKNSIITTTTNPYPTNNLITTTETEVAAIGNNNNNNNRNNKSSSLDKTDIDDFSSGLDTNKQINTDSAFDITDNDNNMKFKIRHIDSGEMAWWMKDNNNNNNNDDDTTVAEDMKSLSQQDEQTSESVDLSSAWWTRQDINSGGSSNNNNNKNELNKNIQNKNQSNENQSFWWINDNDITTKSMNTINKNKSRSNGYSDTNNNNNNNNSNESNCWQRDNYNNSNLNINNDQLNKSNNNNNINNCLNEPPWYKNTNNINNNYTINYESSQNIDNKFNINKNDIKTNNGISLQKIQRIQSGERPWWLDETNNNQIRNNDKSLSNSDISNGSCKPWYLSGPTKKLLNIQRIESGEKAWWLQDNPVEEKSDESSSSSSSDDDDDEIHHVINGTQQRNINNNHHQNYNNTYNQLEIPLGDRASPEGLEDDSSKSRKSPYDNIPSKNHSSSDTEKLKQQQQQQQQQLTNAEINLQKLFISRHTNIDELLGGSLCRPISPILDRIMTKNLFLEEIQPSQVRIHDSTAQIPFIQRMDRDEWDYSARESMLFDSKQNNLDDAALQIYKDGDFGAYLDLESSLAEQTEEIEGLNSSRKNSIVVRTQLSVRVHAIIEKLLSSEGTELRRALFSLKQIFQEDKDLVHGFVALGGLNCLVRVGNGADQNYQNCILRALGQVMLYVDGMNGVMKHGPTIQWLYSLIASKYRLVVKTALKLLLVFVEYIESNCYLLVNAIHIVDIAKGTTPWTNIMKLLKDYDNADTELLIYATSLINKTLSGLSDQDSFYDESDLLEQQGMEGVIQRYMSRPGTDLDLLDQLQLYEAVLKFEDGETDGIRLPDSSVRKTLRYRSTDSTERRKSRRHSTGTSPLNKTSPKRFTPNTSNGILDEDSSSSSNSNEFQTNGGVFRESAQRDNSNITPSLRRRRERNERQKTFMREQLEAAATNGLRSPYNVNNKDEFNGLGQLVTAMPIHLKNNNDSPPESLLSTTTKTSTPIKSNVIINHDDSNNNNNNNKESIIRSPFSPTKNLLSNTSISVISNGFDKTKLTKNSTLTTSPIIPSSPDRINSSNKYNLLNGNKSPEFLNNKNLVMRSNAINGIMKNIQRYENNNNNNNNSIKCDQINENNNSINSNNSFSNNHKKFENDSNRLNNYYNQLNSPIKTNNILCQKQNNNNNNNNENSQKNHHQQQQSPNHCSNNGNIVNGYTNGHNIINSLVNQQLNGIDNIKKESSHQQQQQQQIVGNQNLLIKSNGQQIIPSAPTSTTTTTPQINTQTLNEPLGNGNLKTFGNIQYVTTQDLESEIDEKKLLLQLKRDHTVKDLTQKLSSLPTSPQEEKPQNRMGDMTGLISKAKEGLAKSKSKGEISRSPSVDQDIKKLEPKKSENELHWDELVKNISRPLHLCDLDFTDLNSDDEKDVLAPRGLGGGIPPPPPPCGMPPPPAPGIPGIPCYPPPPKLANLMPPPPTNLVPPPMFNMRLNLNQNIGLMNGPAGDSNTIKKNKKTVKLFWKEVREDMIPVTIGKTIWDELPQTNVDIQKLEHLFESRAKDLMIKQRQELNKNKEIIVLDHKRSNAINIAMTKLPPPRAIKAAILKMDATVVTREGIDKLLNMLPTDEERGKIQEAQMSNPELPLGSAEQFLLTLSSISELGARLKLWAFRLDFENSEREIAEPLMDLKQGLELLKQNRTFKCILSTLLSVGIFLNGAPVKGFQIEYLAKVPEVKDTVHKHSLLHHLCHMVMESSPDTTDLYSEIGPITRASKADYTDLAHNLIQLETECKASWDRLKLIAKHDCAPQLKQKLVDFLADCAERIILLQIVHRRVTNRYRKFLLWLGVPQHRVPESRPNEFCRILSEFALEYRTTRERVHQQIEKKANHRERNKTRGKMIIDIPKFRSKEDRADAELKQLLGTPSPTSEHFDNTLTWRRRRAVDQVRSPIIMKQNDEQFTDGDDEILESLVKTATKTSGTRPTPRERKRTRHADRKSLRRTLKNGLNDEEKQHVASLIKSY